MLLVTSQLSKRCGSYPGVRSVQKESPNTAWTFTQQHCNTAVAKQRKIKSVHFADTKGLALTSTFFFAKEKVWPEEHRGNTKRIIANFNKIVKKTNGQAAEILNFKSPIASTDLTENVHRNNICLEKIFCTKNGIYGRVQVKNLAFEKHVCVRYTFNSWKTFDDQKASYIPGTSTADGTDTFFFQVNPPLGSHGRKMEFAIRYKVNGGDFWDNNFGDNYRLIYWSS